MGTHAAKPVRADAARNAARIVRAARETWLEIGPDASLEDIARRAGVGIATLYRHFPDKAGLASAALDQAFAEHFAPVIGQAFDDPDPLRALVTVLETALSLGVSQHNIVVAAADLGALTARAYASFAQSLAELTRRGQEAGVLRGDLVPEDILRITAMLTAVQSTMPPDGEGWRRYLALVLDGITRTDASTLPAAPSQPNIENSLAAGLRRRAGVIQRSARPM